MGERNMRAKVMTPTRLLLAAVLFIAVCATGGELLTAQQPASKPPLTLEQLRDLISIGSPDTVIGQEVARRGVGFRVDEKQMAALKRLGAKDATVKALSVFLTNAAIVVSTDPAGADVFLDSRRVGTTGPEGTLRVETKAGPHQIVARMKRYKDGAIPCTVAAGQECKASLVLEMAVGLLNVTAISSNATITIRGVGEQRPPVKELELAPGSYQVSLSGPHLTTLSQQVEITAGKTVSLDMKVEVDPEYLNTAVNQIVGEVTSSPSRAVADAEQLVALAPSNSTGLSVLASARYATGDFSRFEPDAAAALANGGTLVFVFVHHHDMSKVHPARIRLSATQFAFEPLRGENGAVCPTKPFTVPLSAVSASVSASGPDETYLRILVRTDPKNPKKTLEINLAPLSSRAQEVKRVKGIITTTGTALISGREGRAAIEAASRTFGVAESVKRQ
jgi:hypothetical protein